MRPDFSHYIFIFFLLNKVIIGRFLFLFNSAYKFNLIINYLIKSKSLFLEMKEISIFRIKEHITHILIIIYESKFFSQISRQCCILLRFSWLWLFDIRCRFNISKFLYKFEPKVCSYNSSYPLLKSDKKIFSLF